MKDLARIEAKLDEVLARLRRQDEEERTLTVCWNGEAVVREDDVKRWEEKLPGYSGPV